MLILNLLNETALIIHSQIVVQEFFFYTFIHTYKTHSLFGPQEDPKIWHITKTIFFNSCVFMEIYIVLKFWIMKHFFLNKENFYFRWMICIESVQQSSIKVTKITFSAITFRLFFLSLFF